MDKRIETLESLCDLFAKQTISHNDNLIQVNQNLIREIRSLRDVILKQDEEFVEFRILLRKIYDMCLQTDATNQNIRNSMLLNQFNAFKSPQPQIQPLPVGYLLPQNPYLLQQTQNAGPPPPQQQQQSSYTHSIDRLITTPDQQNTVDLNSKLLEMARISQQIHENDSKILTYMNKINDSQQQQPPYPPQFNPTQPPPPQTQTSTITMQTQQIPSNLPSVQQIINFPTASTINGKSPFEQSQIQKPIDSTSGFVNKPTGSFMFGTASETTTTTTNQQSPSLFQTEQNNKPSTTQQQKPVPQPSTTTTTIQQPATSITKPSIVQPETKPFFSIGQTKEDAKKESGEVKPSIFGNVLFNTNKDKLTQGETKPAPSQPIISLEQKPASTSDKKPDFTKWATPDTPSFADLAKGATGPNMFGQNNKPQQSLFGQSGAATGGSPFGQSGAGTGGTLFGQSGASTGGSLFGQSGASTGGSLFGQSGASTGGSLFGQSGASTGGSPFGQSGAGTGGTLFGQSGASTGGSLFGQSGASTGGSLFGQSGASTGGSLFGQSGAATGGSLFGQGGGGVSGGLFGSFKPESIALFDTHGQKVESGKEHAGEDEEEEHVYGTHPEEYEPNVDFKPLVKLEEVEVKTGEEDEVAVFKERCKLFRFDINTKEWKEKGVGEMKILKHKANNTYRILMRREQVHKICANHKITNDIKLEVVSEKQIRWSAQDFSDSELKYELLIAKFSNEDAAKRFKNEFEAAQKQAGQSKPAPAPAPTSSAKGSSSTQKPLSELFKKNTWECPGCYTHNDQSVLKCPCCEAAKPGTESQSAGDSKSAIFAAPKLQVSGGEQTTQKFSFGVQSGTNNQKPTFGTTQLQFGSTQKTETPKDQKDAADGSSKENGGLFKFDSFTSSPKTDSNKPALNNFFSQPPPSTTAGGDKPIFPFVNQFNGAPTNTLFGKPVFGANANPPTSSLFGGLPVDSDLFTIKGDNKPKEEKKVESSGEPKPSLFGNIIFNTNKDTLSQGDNKPLFGAPKDEKKSESTQQRQLDFTTFNIGNSLTFADLAKNSPNKNQQQSGGFGFGASGGLFADFKPEQGVLFGRGGGSKQEEEEGEEEGGTQTGGATHPEEYEPNVEFKPVVKLQEVETKTGEEDEVPVFKERCKLFRFDTEKKEWKEKGVGEMKILKHKENDMYRILMRRDQVLKLCANHRITDSLKFELLNEKQVNWSAQDYSESGGGNFEILAAKFRNADDAKRFKELLESIQKGENVAPKPAAAESASSKSSDEPVIINEVKASKEQVDKAKKYQLPDNFYLYENKEPCKGCPGCNDNNNLVNGDH